MNRNFVVIFLFLTTIAGCKTSQTTMLISDSYNEEKNVTSLMLFPYGNIDIPGKWTKTNYNETSRQHYFKNADSTSIAVALNPVNKYPFHHDSLTNQQWVDKFYLWDSEYYLNQGYTTEILDTDESGDFLIWKISGNNVNTIFLFGRKNEYALNYAVNTDNLTDEQRINFLTELFNRN
ncbi:hypothetical protein [Marinoscillum sp. MHG1-6]|uniref:hypothetical protein n=1 Tax=Marinoscillum sp. MHG1-6 TaxID=2959627 RepID=UPI0021578C59|nr:hypothetical protein [Marinoscillum sp. MHG1-6]